MLRRNKLEIRSLGNLIIAVVIAGQVATASAYEFATHAAMTREALLRSVLVCNGPYDPATYKCVQQSEQRLVDLGFQGWLGQMSLGDNYLDINGSSSPTLRDSNPINSTDELR